MRRDRPCALTSLRTKKTLTSAPPASAAQATGSAPIVIPPTAVAPHSRACSATSSPSAAKARRPQDRALGVDVVRRRRAARQRHLAEDERVRSQLFGQSSTCGHRGAYLRAVLERSLRIVAIVLSLVIAAGFLMFAIDEFDRASTAQRNELAGFEQTGPDAGRRARPREAQQHGARVHRRRQRRPAQAVRRHRDVRAAAGRSAPCRRSSACSSTAS